jgi:hypothetical protein
MELMMRIVRIAKVVVLAGIGVFAGHAALGLGSEFIGPGISGVFDIALLVMAMVLASLTERELFWAAPPKRSGSTHHPRTSR